MGLNGIKNDGMTFYDPNYDLIRISTAKYILVYNSVIVKVRFKVNTDLSLGLKRLNTHTRTIWLMTS